MKRNRILSRAIVIVAVSLCTSCFHRSIGTIDIPETPLLSTDGRYAVVIEPYVSMLDQPGEKGITIAHSRRGDIFTIRGKRILESDNTFVLWIDLGKGWVTEASVQLYSGEEKARTAAKLLD